MARNVIMWFRRDLRLADNLALLRAVELAESGEITPLFVVDEALLAPAGPTRVAYLVAVLESLQSSLGGHLVLRHGDPSTVLTALASEVGASHVVASEDFAPYGRQRDEAVATSLQAQGVVLEFADSPYLVRPGTVFNKTGEPYKVFTPFRKVWETMPMPTPKPAPTGVRWRSVDGLAPSALTAYAGRLRPSYFGALPDDPPPLPGTGEAVAHEALERFVNVVDRYGEQRNLPGIAGTSQLSPHLRWGVLHPRQVAAATIGPSADRQTFLSEIAWREFYADVLFHNPSSVHDVFQASTRHLAVDRDDAAVERFQRWARGETGYPLVDAGMRQLLATGWMHNRVRMVAASFLVKHLHLDWRWGARWFMWRLIDGDVASNQHGWQWTAGTGTDAAPYHRIFNPTMQAERFDPAGTYVHQWIPELAAVSAPQCLQPGGGEGLLAPDGYVSPMIDAKTERDEALRRFAEAREIAQAQRG